MLNAKVMFSVCSGGGGGGEGVYWYCKKTVSKTLI